MADTMVTLVGNVATGVEFKDSPTGGVARFRFAVSARRWDRARADWTDGPTSFYTVWAWRSLAANLAASVSVGEPLVVQGRLRVREEDREGGRRTFVDIEAAAAGHDLSRGTAAFRRVPRTARTAPELLNQSAQPPQPPQPPQPHRPDHSHQPSRLDQGEAVAGLLARASGRDEPGDPWSVPMEEHSPPGGDGTASPEVATVGPPESPAGAERESPAGAAPPKPSADAAPRGAARSTGGGRKKATARSS